MIQKIKELVIKYKGIILYGIFGVLTTVINIAVYAVCYKYAGIPNIPSNIIAWVVAVIFAFITNKLFVFDSKDMSMSVMIPELIKFMAARLATLGVDTLIMFIGVDVMDGPAIIIKAASNIIVIILNYVLSKLVVFRKAKPEQS